MKECRGTLLERVRRGLATEQERLALDAHLTYCESCALHHEIASDFDEVADVQTGDAQLVARLSIAAAQAIGQPASRLVQEPIKQPIRSERPTSIALGSGRRFLPRRSWMKIALAAVFLSGGAAALGWVQIRRGAQPEERRENPVGPASFSEGRQERKSDPIISSADPSRAQSAKAASTEPVSTGPAKVEAPQREESMQDHVDALERTPSDVGVAPGASGDSSSSGRLSKAGKPKSQESKAPPSAAALYRSANDFRRKGELMQAERLYERLQSAHPSSPQAVLSRVSLGGIYLESGRASLALQQFDAYLSSGSGRLAAEALFGKAQSLKVLNRRAEEAQTWQKLLGQYPNSAYSAQARQRLQDR